MINRRGVFKVLLAGTSAGAAAASVLVGSMSASAVGLGPCTGSCIDAGSFYVYYGTPGDTNSNGFSQWSSQVGSRVNVAFDGPQGYDPYNGHTQSDLTIANDNGVEIEASLSDPNPPAWLSEDTVHAVTPDNQYWAGIRGDDVNTWAFGDRTTGFWSSYYRPASGALDLQLTINGSTFDFGNTALASSYASGWVGIGVVAKSSFDTAQWSVEGGTTNYHAYEGWDMKHLIVDVPEPLTTAFATGIALGFGFLFQRQSSKKRKGSVA